MILGIVGGALAIFSAIIMLFFAPMLSSLPGLSDLNDYAGSGITFNFNINDLMKLYNVMAIPTLIGGALGIVGGAVVKKNNTTAGVLMIIGTVLCGLNLMLLVGAILAFIREKHPAQQYVPYTPYPNQPPYPGQLPYTPQKPPYPGQPPYPPQNPQYPGQPPYPGQSQYPLQNPGYPNGQQTPPQYPTRDNEQK